MTEAFLVTAVPHGIDETFVREMLSDQARIAFIGSAMQGDDGNARQRRDRPPTVQIAIDICKESEWDRASAAVREQFGTVSGAVNFVCDGPAGDLLSLSPGAWVQAMNGSVGAACLSHRAIRPLLNRAEGAALVHVTYCRESEAGSVPGVVSAGLESLTRSVSLQWAKANPRLRVNMVRARALDASVIEAVRYLLSTQADFVTGKVLSL